MNGNGLVTKLHVIESEGIKTFMAEVKEEPPMLKYECKFKPPDQHQVDLCTRWLKQFARPRKAVNHKVSSATYKVAVEKWAGEYVTNDAFIAAARAEGYTAVPNPFSPTFFCFNFSLPRKGTAEHTAAGMR